MSKISTRIGLKAIVHFVVALVACQRILNVCIWWKIFLNLDIRVYIIHACTCIAIIQRKSIFRKWIISYVIPMTELICAIRNVWSCRNGYWLSLILNQNGRDIVITSDTKLHDDHTSTVWRWIKKIGQLNCFQDAVHSHVMVGL